MHIHQSNFVIPSNADFTEENQSSFCTNFFINDSFKIENDADIETIVSSNNTTIVDKIYVCESLLETYDSCSFTTYSLVGINLKVTINIKYVNKCAIKRLFFANDTFFYTVYIAIPTTIPEAQLKDLTKKNKLWASIANETFNYKQTNFNTISFSLLGLLNLHVEQ